MKREEIEKAIEKGESVWACDDFLHRVIPYKANEIAITDINTNMPAYELKDLFATKQQAEHYLHHANITRTEHLPFLTWEEFLEERHLSFIGKNEIEYMLCIFGDKIDLAEHRACSSFVIKEWHATEANFYKAYDECVRLFKDDSNVRF